MDLAVVVARLRTGMARLRARDVRRPPGRVVLRLVVWTVIAAAVTAWVWVLWTESISRR